MRLCRRRFAAKIYHRRLPSCGQTAPARAGGNILRTLLAWHLSCLRAPQASSRLGAVSPAQLLVPIVGRANVRKYSWHSARIYLACALLASGASSAQIQALCRWQTEDSLRVYARLNAARYHTLLASAASADVASVSTASLPPLSADLAIRELLGVSLRDAERSAGAAAA